MIEADRNSVIFFWWREVDSWTTSKGGISVVIVSAVGEKTTLIISRVIPTVHGTCAVHNTHTLCV